MTAERSRAYLAGLVFDRLMEIPDSDRRRSESEGSAHAQARASRGASLIHLGRGRLRVSAFFAQVASTLFASPARGGDLVWLPGGLLLAALMILPQSRWFGCVLGAGLGVAAATMLDGEFTLSSDLRMLLALTIVPIGANLMLVLRRRVPQRRAFVNALWFLAIFTITVPAMSAVLPGHEPHDGFARSVGVAMAASVDRARARLSRVRADLVQAGAAVVFGAASIRGKVVGTRRNSRQHDADCARLAFFWIAVLSASPAAGRTDSHCGTDNAAGPHSQHLRCHHAPVGDRAQNDLRGQRTVHRGRCFPDRAEREVLGLHERDGVVVVDDVRDAADQDATRAAQFRPRGSRTRWSRLRGAGTRNARASPAICTTTSTSASRSCRSVSARCV